MNIHFHREIAVSIKQSKLDQENPIKWIEQSYIHDLWYNNFNEKNILNSLSRSSQWCLKSYSEFVDNSNAQYLTIKNFIEKLSMKNIKVKILIQTQTYHTSTLFSMKYLIIKIVQIVKFSIKKCLNSTFSSDFYTLYEQDRKHQIIAN